MTGTPADLEDLFDIVQVDLFNMRGMKPVPVILHQAGIPDRERWKRMASRAPHLFGFGALRMQSEGYLSVCRRKGMGGKVAGMIDMRVFFDSEDPIWPVPGSSAIFALESVSEKIQESMLFGSVLGGYMPKWDDVVMIIDGCIAPPTERFSNEVRLKMAYFRSAVPLMPIPTCNNIPDIDVVERLFYA